MSKESFFFKHDYNARNDPKMSRLRRALGWEGSGVAWALIEMLYEQGGRISADYEQLAYELRVEQEVVTAVVGSDIFFVEDGMIGSERVDRAFEERRAIAAAGRDSVDRRKRPDGSPWVKNRDLLGAHDVPNTRRGEEKREDNIRPNGPVDSPILKPVTAGDDYTGYRLPKNFGSYGGCYIENIPPDECAFLIERMNPGPKVLAALKWRIGQKEREKTPAQREASKA